jgi:hypothetical protein
MDSMASKLMTRMKKNLNLLDHHRNLFGMGL